MELAARNVLWYTSQKKVQQQAMEAILSKNRQHVDYVLSLKACKIMGWTMLLCRGIETSLEEERRY